MTVIKMEKEKFPYKSNGKRKYKEIKPPMTFREKWNKTIADAWVSNINDVLSGDYCKKNLKTRAEEMGEDTVYLESRIASGCKVTARLLCKNPTKQNMQEDAQRDYIIGQVDCDFEILPKKNDMTFSLDGFKTKTLDAIVNDNMYVAMKLVTCGDHYGGGTQSSQRNEIRDFITIASKVRAEENKDYYIVGLIDDDKPKPRNFYLEGAVNCDKVFVGGSEEFIEYLKEI